MNNQIANLIKRAEAFLETHQGGTHWSRADYAERRLLCDAIAEVKAARARIAKLEQEPPMSLVDLHGIRDDLQFLDDVRKQNQQLRAEVASLREGQRELARAVKFLDMCNKQRIASGDTGAMGDAWQWVEEAAREMIEAAKETNQ